MMAFFGSSQKMIGFETKEHASSSCLERMKHLYSEYTVYTINFVHLRLQPSHCGGPTISLKVTPFRSGISPGMSNRSSLRLGKIWWFFGWTPRSQRCNPPKSHCSEKTGLDNLKYFKQIPVVAFQSS